VRVEQGKGKSWAVPSSLFASSSEVIEGELLVRYALMDLSESIAPVLFLDVNQIISAQSSRDTPVQKRAHRIGRV